MGGIIQSLLPGTIDQMAHGTYLGENAQKMSYVFRGSEEKKKKKTMITVV